jgi:hypothetical protein
MGRPRTPKPATRHDQPSQIPEDIRRVVASYERDLFVEYLVHQRRQRSAQDGRGSGPLPQGFVRLADGTLSIDGAAAPVIRTVLVLRREHTYQETADRLNAAGYRTAKGCQWTPAHVYKIDRHRALYETGVREWDGIRAEQRWPVLCPPEERSA